MAYRCRGHGDEALRIRLEALASQYPRYGYLLLHGILKREKLVINAKRTAGTETYSDGSILAHRNLRSVDGRPSG